MQFQEVPVTSIVLQLMENNGVLVALKGVTPTEKLCLQQEAKIPVKAYHKESIFAFDIAIK